jgi:hypothetical protein
MSHKTSDVFGVKSTLIKSYIERDTVDEKFRVHWKMEMKSLFMVHLNKVKHL